MAIAGVEGSSLCADQVIPTTLVAMAIGNALTAATFYGLGALRRTSGIVSFVPAPVIAGFLACIGYKVRRPRSPRCSGGDCAVCR